MKENVKEWVEHAGRNLGLLSLAIGSVVILVVAGPQFLYFLSALVAIGAYALYPDLIEKWFQTHQAMLLGGAIGFIAAGPIGLAVGAWLGHYLNQKYNQAVELANKVAETARPIAHPIAYTQEKTKAAGRWVYESVAAVGKSVLTAVTKVKDVIIGNEEEVNPEDKKEEPKATPPQNPDKNESPVKSIIRVKETQEQTKQGKESQNPKHVVFNIPRQIPTMQPYAKEDSENVLEKRPIFGFANPVSQREQVITSVETPSEPKTWWGWFKNKLCCAGDALAEIYEESAEDFRRHPTIM